MAQQLVECIPNFSEGRRSEIVDAIAGAIQAVAGITLLDRSSDPDHNRSVVTFVGSPASVEKAAFQGIAKAAQLIDMTKHKGEFARLLPATLSAAPTMARRNSARPGQWPSGRGSP